VKTILHCITDLSPDGAQRVLLRLVEQLPKNEFKSVIVTLVPGGHLTDRFVQAGAVVETLGMRRGVPGVRALLRMRKHLLKYQPDVIQGWMYHGNLVATLGAAIARSKARLLWNIRRCLDAGAPDKFLTRLVIRGNALLSSWPEAIVYCVTAAADQHEAIGFDRTKRVVIPNGYDLTKLSQHRPEHSALRAELGLSQDAVVIGSVGRNHPQKDYENLCRAAADVVQKRPDAHFVVIGRGVDESAENFQEWRRTLGLNGQLHLMGERQDLPQLLPQLDLFCSSSANEGFSNVLAEAMASGVPCVATDIGASAELLAELGRIVPVRDSKALAEGVLELIGTQPHARRELGMQGRRLIEERYTLQRMIGAYAALYRR
jgi:glycosyltransferase involved in cell wall biosynthesis